MAAGLVACAPQVTPTPAAAANPDLVARCGIDVNLVIDRSGSVAGSQTEVQAAAQAFVDGMAGTGSRVRMASFASLATTHPNGDAQGSSAISDLTWSLVDDYHVPLLTPGGGTNLEGGLELVRRAPGPIGALTIVFTDGEPNEHYLSGPDGHPGINANLGRALSDAVGEANAIKSAGSHIVAVGIAGDTGISTDTLQQISGPDPVNAATPIERGDYLSVDDFAAAIPQFRALADRLCGPSLTVKSYVRYPARGEKDLMGITLDPAWQFDVSATPAPSRWVGTSTPSGATTTLVTGLAGSATATWDTPGTTTLAMHSVPKPNLSLFSVTCTTPDPAGGKAIELPTGLDVATGNWTVTVDDTQRVTCTQVVEVDPPDPGFGQVILVGQNRTGGLDPLALTFDLTDAGGQSDQRHVNYPGLVVWDHVVPGTHTVSSPAMPPGWVEESFRCALGAPTLFSSPSHTIEVTADEGWTCVSVANRPATSAVLRLTTSVKDRPTPDPIPVSWSLASPAGSDVVQRGVQPASLQWTVDAGSYVLSQDEPAPELRLIALTCGGVPQNLRGASLTLAPGSVTDCAAIYTPV